MNYEGSATVKQGGKKTLDFPLDTAVNPLMAPFEGCDACLDGAPTNTLREKDVR